MRSVAIIMVAALLAGSAAHARPAREAGGLAGWLAHQWVAAPPDSTQIDGLCALLRRHGIDTVFAHVGPADASGNIVENRAPYAARFAAAMQHRCPTVRLLAWIGQLLPSWDGVVNLDSGAVRANLAHTARRFVADGFAGVQFDLEPVADGDPALLDLLRRTRALTTHAWIAVASPALRPGRGLPALPHLRLPLTPWSPQYYRRVAALVDELDPMLYVTSLRSASYYSEFIAEQARDLRQLLPAVRLTLALPAFEDRSAVFDSRVENLSSGCLGLRMAQQTAAEAEAPRIAVYPLWDITLAGWTMLDNCLDGSYSA